VRGHDGYLTHLYHTWPSYDLSLQKEENPELLSEDGQDDVDHTEQIDLSTLPSDERDPECRREGYYPSDVKAVDEDEVWDTKTRRWVEVTTTQFLTAEIILKP
jgi:hypothetical protein